MNRSNYDNEGDTWGLIRYRGAVNSAIKGKRGQCFLKEMAEAMDAMPVKRLIGYVLEHKGEFCALGVVFNSRGLNIIGIDSLEYQQVDKALNISEALAREIEFMNDEAGHFNETPEYRHIRMREWIESNIKKETKCKLILVVQKWLTQPQ